MKAMIPERKRDLQAAEMVAAVAAILEAGDTQEVAATRVVVGTLAEAIQAVAVIRAAVAIRAVAAILVEEVIPGAAATLAEVTPGDLTMAIGTPVTTKRFRN
jgi:hypothetical protein